jgi:hypothetical protein
MVSKKINIEEFRPYIDVAFNKDYELIDLYDKSVDVKSIEEICENVFYKISSLIKPCELRGVLVKENPIGYFAFETGSLISFGVNKQHRYKEHLSEFWELIKHELGGTFTTCLFSYNIRAINWLKKCNMNILFDNLTVLQCLQ